MWSHWSDATVLDDYAMTTTTNMHHLRSRPLERFFLYKIRRGEGVPGPWPREKKLHDCGFKNVGLLAPKSPKLVFFGINVPKKGYIPLSDFYKIWLDGLVDQLPSPHPLAKFNHCHF